MNLVLLIKIQIGSESESIEGELQWYHICYFDKKKDQKKMVSSAIFMVSGTDKEGPTEWLDITHYISHVHCSFWF